MTSLRNIPALALRSQRPTSLPRGVQTFGAGFQKHYHPPPATKDTTGLGTAIRSQTLTGLSRGLRSGHIQPQSSHRWKSDDRSHVGRWSPAAGSEPGFNPAVRDPKVEHLSPKSVVEIHVVDYSHDQLVVHTPAAQLLDDFFLKNPKPEWASCRWIYVNGIEPEVVRCLGNHKDLHPLALEDVLDMQTPTKVNWYENHCYIEMNMVKLTEPTEGAKSASSGEMPGSLMRKRFNGVKSLRSRSLASDKFSLSWEQASAFLTIDGTVITIFEQSGKDVFDPILERLQSKQTVVRSSNDPSMLLQAVIDTTVDLSLPIGKAVAEIFDDLERAVLYNPRISQSKQLHVLRSGLTLLLNNTIAIGGLVKTLCDHRPVGDVNEAPTISGRPAPKPANHLASGQSQITPLARMYFQDVQDHIQTLSNGTHMSIRSAENLSTLIFNSITANQNESVRKLTLVSSFFLPLTFLTSYFGMNFDTMPSVNDQNELVFWMIATPVMLGTLVLITVGPKWRNFVSLFRRHKQDMAKRGDGSGR
jgi:Mg2+ and Co2+ transporter CorA